MTDLTTSPGQQVWTPHGLGVVLDVGRGIAHVRVPRSGRQRRDPAVILPLHELREPRWDNVVQLSEYRRAA